MLPFLTLLVSCLLKIRFGVITEFDNLFKNHQKICKMIAYGVMMSNFDLGFASFEILEFFVSRPIGLKYGSRNPFEAPIPNLNRSFPLSLI